MNLDSELQELSDCNEVGFISLREEPEFNLCIIVEASNPERRFEISWPSYISYAVRSEHFCQWDADEVWEGKHVFRVYTKSKFLDFVAAGTLANDVCPDPFRHYQIQSIYPIIDVASMDPPTVKVTYEAQPLLQADGPASGGSAA